MLQTGAGTLFGAASCGPHRRNITACNAGRKTFSSVPDLLNKPHRRPQEAAPVLRPPPEHRSPASATGAPSPAMQLGYAADILQAPKVTLAVVGDVHSQWTADDEAALESLGADVAVFVGDFGEESLALVQRIAALQHPKVVVLGNHDAWYSLTPSGRRRYARAMLNSSNLATRREDYSEAGSTPAIAAQLQALGDDHIGYGSKRFPSLGLTLLGARPFSKGGKQWSDVAAFYNEHFGVSSHQDSAMRLLDLALAAEPTDCKVVVAHNGPRGLGGRRFSICGVDWTEPEADFGDPDLQEALDMMHAQGVRVPLVLFGHMHSQLSGGGARNMLEADHARGTVYLNCAVVPRIRTFSLAPSTLQSRVQGAQATIGSSSNTSGQSGMAGPGGSTGKLRSREEHGSADASSSGGTAEAIDVKAHHFVLIELRGQVVTAARDAWVAVLPDSSAVHNSSPHGSGTAGNLSDGRRCVVVQQQELLTTAFPMANRQPSMTAAAALAEQAATCRQPSQLPDAMPQPRAALIGNGNGSTSSAAAQKTVAEAEAGADESGSSYVCSIYRAHTQEWEHLVFRAPPVQHGQLAAC